MPKTQYQRNIEYRKAKKLVRFIVDMPEAEKMACDEACRRSGTLTKKDIVLAGMHALGIKVLINDHNHNKVK